MARSMLLSRCCKADIFVLTDYYMCENCHQACRTYTPIGLEAYDARYASEAKEGTHTE